jgi:ABC-type Fe3+-hydroxamate transport system substrate-binding protein
MKTKITCPISSFILLTSAFLLSACSSTPIYPPPPYPISAMTDSPVEVEPTPARVVPANPPAVTSTEVVTESRYKDGKLKQREVVSKSQYKKGKLIKHQSVEREIVSESNKIQ